MSDLSTAMLWASRHHHRQKDKSGFPYINHIIEVVRRVDGELLKTIAALHDIIEDAKVTPYAIEQQFGNVVSGAVIALSRREGEGYDDFITRVSANPLATTVKLADLEHNMDLSRLNRELTDKDIDRQNKYQRAVITLKKSQSSNQ